MGGIPCHTGSPTHQLEVERTLELNALQQGCPEADIMRMLRGGKPARLLGMSVEL
jgi:hypothetical protein